MGLMGLIRSWPTLEEGIIEKVLVEDNRVTYFPKLINIWQLMDINEATRGVFESVLRIDRAAEIFDHQEV